MNRWTLVALTFAGVSLCGTAAAANTTRRPQRVSIETGPQRYVYPNPDIPTLKGALRAERRGSSPEARLERRLWHLLATGRLRRLRHTIAKQRSTHTGWHPPPQLTVALAHAELRARINAARSRPKALVALFKRHPEAFSCREYYNLWSLADAQRALGKIHVAAEIYRQMLAECRASHVLLATLDRVAAQEGAAAAIGQAAALQRRPGVAIPAMALNHRLYRWRLQRGAALRQQNRKPQALAVLEPLADAIERRRDQEAARLLAWSYLDTGHTHQAIAWFTRIANWSSKESDRLVELQARFNAGERAPVIAWLRHHHLSTPKARHWAAAILRGEAARRYTRRDCQSTLDLLATAKRYGGPNDVDTAMLAGWSHYKLGQYRQAQEVFARIYGAHITPSQRRAAAKGVLLSARRDHGWQGALALAKASGGVLLSTPRERQLARSLAGGKLSVNDVQVIGAHLHKMEHEVASAVATGAGRIERGGGSGLDRYTLWRRPLIHWQWSAGSGYMLTGRIDAYDLRSGTPAGGSWIGSGRWQVSAPIRAASFDAHGVGALMLGVRRTDTPWFLELGRSAGGGAIGPTWLGRLGYDQRGSHRGITVALYRRPRRDSLLSYVGMVDPYSGKRWGRVIEQGIAADGYERLTPRWQMGGHLAVFDLQGASVAGNHGEELYLAWQRTVEMGRPRSKLRLGPYIYATGYAKNLSQYSFGQGGYYSPKWMWQTGVSGEWLHSSANSVLRIRADIGYQYQRTDASPVFPLGGTSSTFSASSSNGLSGRLTVSWVQQLGTTSWQWAGLLSAMDGPAYSQNEQWLFLRYRFGHGREVRARDLPERWMPTLPRRF